MNLIAKLLMNSLYGKFGMKTTHSTVNIYDMNNPEDKKFLDDLLEDLGEFVQDIFQLGHHMILCHKNVDNYRYDESTDLYHGMDVNIAIACVALARITAGGRMVMSTFKNRPGLNLYYTDTDSIVIDRELPEVFIGNGLGKLKLEHTISEAVFLAPKVYGFRTHDGKEIVKVKGITKKEVSNLSLRTLAELLVRDTSIVISQEKWFKQVFKGRITVADVGYQLMMTSTKRKPVYNAYGAYYDTTPYFYKELE
jgi:hypothetical protein